MADPARTQAADSCKPAAQPRSNGIAVLAGFAAIWLVLDRSAAWLGSTMGEAGLFVATLTVGTALIVERATGGGGWTGAATQLGFRTPSQDGLRIALVLAVLLLAIYPVFSLTMDAPLALAQHWPVLAVGLFAQGGIAEETLFRGYLFRHLRTGRSFWGAASLASLPFVAVHLLLFLSLDPAIALAALGVSVALSFPLCFLFERSGNSVWPPAILHFLVQGSIKLFTVPQAHALTLAITWMVVAALIPWLVFLVRSKAENVRV